MIYDIIIIGGGASGLFLASQLQNKNFLILETNNKIAQKLEISGGGKCNISNKYVSEDNFVGNSIFFKKVYSEFTNIDLINFFRKNNVDIKLNSKIIDGQYFCKNAKYVIDFFKNSIKQKNIATLNKVLDISKQNNIFNIQTENNIFKSKKLVIASGGISYPQLNVTDIGYKVAMKFEHKISKLSPALVGFTVQKEQFWFKELSGISVNVNIKLINNKKEFNGNILFAHKGITGPVILNLSLYWEKGMIAIDFLPHHNLDKLLNIDKNVQISTALKLPKKFIKLFLNSINLQDKQIKNLSDDDKKKLNLIKNYTFSPAGNFGYKKAEITKGGVKTDEINSSNMESLKEKNLFFIGEVLDMNGELGGYNLQWAFSSAYLCSKYLNNN